MNSSSFPLVSIGMPVFNEACFLQQSLESLVQQDYLNIELIISDNASTDDTENICREYAAKYDWINYHRFNENQGPARNFNYVLQAATGQYFMWAAGHDLWEKNYLGACVEILESHPNAIIAYGSSQWINEHNETFGREYGWVDTRGMDIIARYFTIFWGNMNPILGVIRRKILIEAPIIDTVGNDLIILSYLSLKGDFLHAFKTSWNRREFRQETSYKDKLLRYKNKNFKLSNSLFSKIFPLAQLPLELIKIVLFTKNLTIRIKISILFLLIPLFPIRYFMRKNQKINNS